MKKLLLIPLGLIAAGAGAATRLVQDQCGPFTDVSPQFCPYVLEAYYTGITAGTSPTTFSPDIPITRGQAAVFVSKGLNQALARSSRRAALGRWWTTQNANATGTVSVSSPRGCACDGTDIWVVGGADVVRVHGSDMTVSGTWTGPVSTAGAVAAMGAVFVTGTDGTKSHVYGIQPGQPPGAMTVVADVGANADGIAFDGGRLWTANSGAPPGSGSVSIVTPGPLPWPVTTLTAGFTSPRGILFDGSNIWVTDYASGPGASLLKLDSNGAVLQTIALGGDPGYPVFDGANIWVPSNGFNVSVIQASTGQVLATLPTPNGAPYALAFDGERILATSWTSAFVTVWRAADFSVIGNPQAAGLFGLTYGACSDGLSFWITNLGGSELIKFD